MKRHYYISIALCCLAFLSCNRENFGNGGDSGLKPIEFTTNLRALEKPSEKTNLVEDESTLKLQPISLYGWFYYPTIDGPVFAMNNLPLEWINIGWDYSPRQYWMQTAYGYGFAGIWPYMKSRGEITPSTDPSDDSYHTDDIVRNIIARISPMNAYLTKSLDDVMVGYAGIEKEYFGRTVNLPIEHSLSAFRVRVRNLADQNMVIANWYLTNLACHADAIVGIIGRNAAGDVTQPMTRIPDNYFKSIEHAPVNVRGAKDKITLMNNFVTPAGVPIPDGEYLCVDDAITDNNYRFVVLSQRLAETSDHEPSDAELAAVQSVYANMGYTNYSKNIYWGNLKGLPDNHYYMPVAYVNGASIYDYDNNGIRGNQGDVDKNVRVFECRSHFYDNSTKENLTVAQTGEQVVCANGGIFLPISETNEALLYSPYFFSSGSFTGTPGDWTEGSEIAANSSIFNWVDNNASPYAPTNITPCIQHYNDLDGTFTSSVAAGDLKDALNEDGYVLVFPQEINNVELHIWSALTDASEPSTSTQFTSASEKFIHLANYTKGTSWKPGYKYDYLVTITSKKILVSLDVQPWDEREYILE